jgi:hypothetical protein
MKKPKAWILNSSSCLRLSAVRYSVVVWLLLTMLAVRDAGGQGTISFNTRITGALVNQTAHIWAPSTSNPGLSLIGLGSNDTPSGTTLFGSATAMALIGASGSGGQYGYRTTFAQLIGAVGQNVPESAFVPLAGVTTFRSGTSLGCVASTTSTFTNNPASVDAPWATVEIVAWDNSSGLYPSWTQASAAWQSGLISAGHSAPFNVANIGGTANGNPVLTSAGQPISGFSFNLGFYFPTPSVVTLSATDLTPFSATFNGLAYPNYCPNAQAFFQWGTTTNYGNTTDKRGLVRTNSVEPISEWSPIWLVPGTTYHYRLCAYVTYLPTALACGSDASFTTPMPIATLPATAITDMSATLNATVNPSSFSASAWFEWGPTTNYGNLTAATDLGHGTNPLPVSATLNALIPSTNYHFRVVSLWSDITTLYGNDQSVETTVAPLVINTGSGYWAAAISNLSYQGGTPNFILLQSADATAPLSTWTRIATNNSTPGSFPIPPVGTAGSNYYRVMSE